jgi:hypothetical protein
LAGGKASEKKLKLAERRHRAAALRKSSIPFRSIAKAIASEFPDDFPNYDESMAWKDVRHILKYLNDQALEDVALMRRMEDERLDVAAMAIARQVQAGDLQAIGKWLQIIERRCKMWGLDLPPADRPIADTTTSEIELQLITPDSL